MKRENWTTIGIVAVILTLAAMAYWNLGGAYEYPLLNQAAAPMELVTLDGAPLPFREELGNKVVVLNFWASWCPPCMQELPEIAKLAEEMKDSPVAIYSVATESEHAVIRSAIADMNPEPPVALDPTGRAVNAYQVRALPTTVILDKNGVIRDAFIGYTSSTIDDIRTRALELAEAPASADAPNL